MKRRKTAAFTLIVVVMMALLVPSFSGYAQEPESDRYNSKVIRVGNPNIESFIETTGQQRVTGYGAAYLNKIAEKTGWKYRYISGSWSQCMEMLRNGEIDIFLPAEKTAERQQEFLFSKTQCCREYVGLYTRKENEQLCFEDYESFDGLRIGMFEGNSLNQLLFQVAEKKGFQFIPVYYEDQHQADAALERKEVDAVVNWNLVSLDTQKLLMNIGSLPGYVITNIKDKELMDEIDQAVDEIQLEAPYFQVQLFQEYYGDFDTMAEGWTKEELNFIKNCPTLRVVCDADTNPISWRDPKTGEFKGIYVEILKMITENSGLKIEFVSPQNLSDPWGAVERGEGDLIAAAYADPELEKQYNLCFTEPYYPEKDSIISRRGRDFDPSQPMKIALLDSFVSTQRCITQLYPQWTIITCKTMQDCFKKVAEGDADITMADTIKLPNNNYLSKYPTLGTVSTMIVEIPISIGVSKNQVENPEMLRAVLNKAIKNLSKEKIDSYVLSYTIERDASIQLMDLIRINPTLCFSFIFLLLLLICIAGIVLYGNRLKTLQNAQLTLKNQQLEQAVQEAQDARDMYNGLYNMAVCGIVQLQVDEQGRYTLLNANNEAKDILGGSSEDKDRLFGTDLRSLVHGKDRAALKKVMNSLEKKRDRALLEFQLTCFDQESIWIRSTLELVDFSSNRNKKVQATFTDITESKKFQDQLKAKSERDSLTDLYNKGAMERYCKEYLTTHSSVRCAFCIIDIDDFKNINDTYGHRCGDEVLKQISSILKSAVQDRGLAGRFGGDEFVVLFHGVKASGVQQYIRMVMKQIAAVQVEGVQHQAISTSIGIAMGTGRIYEELFEKADHALYTAKLQGKKCFHLVE